MMSLINEKVNLILLQDTSLRFSILEAGDLFPEVVRVFPSIALAEGPLLLREFWP